MGASGDFAAVCSWVSDLIPIITAKNFLGSKEECDLVRKLASYLLTRCMEYERGLGGGDLLGSEGEGAGEGWGSLSGKGGDCGCLDVAGRVEVVDGGWPGQWQHMGMPDAEWASSLHVWPRQTLAQPPPLFGGQPLLESHPPWQLHRQRQWQ